MKGLEIQLTMKLHTTFVSTLVLMACLLPSGCTRTYGPLFANETDTIALIVIDTRNTEQIERRYEFEVNPGTAREGVYRFQELSDFISIKITYGEEDSTSTFEREYLERKLPELGGVDEAVFLILHDGIQVISKETYQKDSAKRTP